MKRLTAALATGVIAVACVGVAGMLYTTAMQRRATEAELAAVGTDVTGIRQAFETMYLNTDSAYIYTTTSPLIRANEAYGIFHAFPQDYFKNNRLLGGWDTRSPAYNDYKERYGLENLPRDLAGSDVLVVQPGGDWVVSYLQQAYGMQVEYQAVQQLSETMSAQKLLVAEQTGE